MSTRDIRIEVLTDLLEEHGVTATPEAISAIADDFASHIEMEHEMESNQFDQHRATCDNCTALRAEVARLESELEVFRSNVRRRRGLSDSAPVYVQDGSVLYDNE